MRELGTIRSLTENATAQEIRLPQSVRRSPDFDNGCPEFWWGERPREPRYPESKTCRPAFGDACSGFDRRRPDLQNSRPGLVNRCPDFFRLCPGFQTFAPFLKASAPISGAPRSLYNLLPHSNLSRRRRKETHFSPASQSLVTSAPTISTQLQTANS
jgi:hypothetical protein